MSVSIVMPVRNAAATLPIALASIEHQTLSDWQLIAVDDGSMDSSGSILKAAAQADARIHVLAQPANGIVEALQRGCAAAQGEFIARMDADDWMSPDRLLRQSDFLERHPGVGLVSCKVRHGGDESGQAGYAEHVAWLNSLATSEQIQLRRFVESPVAHPSVTFRRCLLDRHGGYAAGDFPEDYELWLRWLHQDVVFDTLNSELLLWNDSAGRLSRTEGRYRTRAFYQTKCLYLAQWLRRHVKPTRQIWLWGAGRVTRQRFRFLELQGITLRGFIDVDPKKQGRTRDGRPVQSPSQLPPADESFIIAGVGSRGARDLIMQELERQSRIEGRDFLLAA
jgi:glycosyltransferase involved in cell wall biosynthesis